MKVAEIRFNGFVALAAARDAVGLKARDYQNNVVYAQCNTHFCFENGKKNSAPCLGMRLF